MNFTRLATFTSEIVHVDLICSPSFSPSLTGFYSELTLKEKSIKQIYQRQLQHDIILHH